MEQKSMKHEGRASHRAAFPATISQLFQAFYLHNPELVVAVPGEATLEVVSTQVVSSLCLFCGEHLGKRKAVMAFHLVWVLPKIYFQLCRNSVDHL